MALKSINSAFDKAIIEAIGNGLPLVKRPYLAIADQIGCQESQVIEVIQRLKQCGDLKRFGVVVRHRKLGYRANAMVVWNIPDLRVAEIGTRISQTDFVTLCYQRPRRLPAWPYNLFCMIHGKDKDDVGRQLEQLIALNHLEEFDYDILFSARCFKQRGARYSAEKSEHISGLFANRAVSNG